MEYIAWHFQMDQTPSKVDFFVTCDDNLIKKLKQRFSVQYLAVFGSILKGTATPDSDVDILVRYQTSLRNILIHEYFGLDNELLWKTIQDDLPL